MPFIILPFPFSFIFFALITQADKSISPAEVSSWDSQKRSICDCSSWEIDEFPFSSSTKYKSFAHIELIIRLKDLIYLNIIVREKSFTLPHRWRGRRGRGKDFQLFFPWLLQYRSASDAMKILSLFPFENEIARRGRENLIFCFSKHQLGLRALSSVLCMLLWLLFSINWAY